MTLGQNTMSSDRPKIGDFVAMSAARVVDSKSTLLRISATRPTIAIIEKRARRKRAFGSLVILPRKTRVVAIITAQVQGCVRMSERARAIKAQYFQVRIVWSQRRSTEKKMYPSLMANQFA